MSSTDVDGSQIIVLSQIEAETIFRRLEHLAACRPLNEVKRGLVRKIARELNYPQESLGYLL